MNDATKRPVTTCSLCQRPSDAIVFVVALIAWVCPMCIAFAPALAADDRDDTRN